MFQRVFDGAAAIARRVTGCGLGAAVALMLLAPPASAVNVTVGTTTYDISFAGFSRSFLDDQALIEATPWWGNQTLATDIANAYLADIGVGGSPFTDNPNPNTQLWFAYETGTVGSPMSFDVVRFTELNEADPPEFPAEVTEGRSALDTDRLSNATFAILGSATPIPEINAGSLAQALFILLALHLWIRTRRRGWS